MDKNKTHISIVTPVNSVSVSYSNLLEIFGSSVLYCSLGGWDPSTSLSSFFGNINYLLHKSSFHMGKPEAPWFNNVTRYSLASAQSVIYL